MVLQNLSRRRFLNGAGSVSISSALIGPVVSPSQDFELGDLINHKETAARLTEEIGTFLLEVEQDSKSFAIDVADEISEAYNVAKDVTNQVLPDPVDHIFDIEALVELKDTIDLSVKHVRPLYKFLDVFGSFVNTTLPTLPLYRALLFGAKLSSIGGLLIAIRAFGEAAETVVDSAEQNGSITDDQNEQFYFTAFLLTFECVFLAVPLDFGLAWKGTRWATNRLLFRIRRLPAGNKLLALVMSFVHWVLRDVPHEAAYNLDQVPELASYISAELQTRGSELEDVDPPSATEVQGFIREMFSEYLEVDSV